MPELTNNQHGHDAIDEMHEEATQGIHHAALAVVRRIAPKFSHASSMCESGRS